MSSADGVGSAGAGTHYTGRKAHGSPDPEIWIKTGQQEIKCGNESGDSLLSSSSSLIKIYFMAITRPLQSEVWAWLRGDQKKLSMGQK